MGQIPNKELVDGGLVLFGALMLTPGFLTDALGLLLLFPLTRPIFGALSLVDLNKRLQYLVNQIRTRTKNNSRNSFFFYRNDQGEYRSTR